MRSEQLALFVVGLLLLGLLWESIRYRDEKPLFITMVDNSSSMQNYSDSAKVKQRIQDFQQQLEQRFGDEFELMTLEVGEKTGNLKTLDFSGKQTNLAGGFEHVRELFFNRNIGAITLISDGNFNTGTHPMYPAERIELTPVFTLGVGDTITRRDQLIKSVNTNEVAFLNNQFPIDVTVDFNRIPVGPTTVSLVHQGRTIATQTVNCTNSVSSISSRYCLTWMPNRKDFNATRLFYSTKTENIRLITISKPVTLRSLTTKT